MAVIGRAPEAQQQAPADDFYQFCKDLGLIRSQDLDEQLSVGTGLNDVEDLHMLHDVNDLYGKLSNNSFDAGDAFDPQEASSILESLWGPEHHTAHTPAPGGCTHSSSHPEEGTTGPQQQAVSASGVPRVPSQGNFVHSHRAVTTAMPFMPGSPSAAMVANGLKDPAAIAAAAAAAVAAPGAADDDDTRSVDTLPMPHKRRRLNGQEASSRPSPNDRAYLPTSSSGAVAGTGSTATAAAARPPRSSPQQQQPAAAMPQGMVPVSNNNNQGSTEPVKAVLVSKVLTKSDASSKRIILPRIAVEANLPQVTQGGGKTFYFDATDPSGATWPLCIKAWANGQNPKPVYVLEQVGDLLKQHKLGVGDAVAVLASRSGSFFIEWNTQQAHSAAARPTYSAFTFSTAAAAGGAPQQQQQQQPDEAKQQPQQQQEGGQPSPAAAAVPEVADNNTAATQQQPAGSVAAASPFAAAAAPQQQQQQASPTASPAPAGASNGNGGWYANMPADLLVCERVGPVDPFDRPPHPRAADAFLTIDDSQPSLPLDGAALAAAVAAAGGAGAAAAAGTKVSAAELLQRHEADLRAVMVDGDVVEGEGGALHQGGYLVCPRTPGCTRAAGHQGWCVGHKGFKKRGRNGAA